MIEIDKLEIILLYFAYFGFLFATGCTKTLTTTTLLDDQDHHLHDLDHPQGLLQHEVPKCPESLHAGGVLPSVPSKPAHRQLALIRRPHNLLAGVELSVPVAHALAVLVEPLNILDIGLAVKQSLRPGWHRVEQRL